MDVLFPLHGQTFEWDAQKAVQNLKKHEIPFERACEVFFDPFVRLVDASDHGETRDAALGLTENWQFLFVVHLVRPGEAIRIISARPATPSERKVYEHE